MNTLLLCEILKLCKRLIISYGFILRKLECDSSFPDSYLMKRKVLLLFSFRIFSLIDSRLSDFFEFWWNFWLSCCFGNILFGIFFCSENSFDTQCILFINVLILLVFFYLLFIFRLFFDFFHYYLLFKHFPL